MVTDTNALISLTATDILRLILVGFDFHTTEIVVRESVVKSSKPMNGQNDWLMAAADSVHRFIAA